MKVIKRNINLSSSSSTKCLNKFDRIKAEILYGREQDKIILIHYHTKTQHHELSSIVNEHFLMVLNIDEM